MCTHENVDIKGGDDKFYVVLNDCQGTIQESHFNLTSNIMQ